MSALRFALRTLARDWKSGELNVLLLAVIVAVAARTAVGFFTNRVSEASCGAGGAKVLAADLRLQSSQPISTEYATVARKQGLRTASALSLVSVIFYGEKSQLTSVRAVDAGLPVARGRAGRRTSRSSAGTTRDIPARGEIWADSRLLATLDAAVGSRLSIRATSLLVARVLDYRPDQGSTFAELAPNALAEPRGCSGHAACSTGKPGDVPGAVCRNACAGHYVQGVSRGRTQAGRAASRYYGGEPSGPFLDGSRRAVSQSRRTGQRAASTLWPSRWQHADTRTDTSTVLPS